MGATGFASVGGGGLVQENRRRNVGGSACVRPLTVLLILPAETRAPCLSVCRGLGGVSGTVWTCLWKNTGTHTHTPSHVCLFGSRTHFLYSFFFFPLNWFFSHPSSFVKEYADTSMSSASLSIKINKACSYGYLVAFKAARIHRNIRAQFTSSYWGDLNLAFLIGPVRLDNSWTNACFYTNNASRMELSPNSSSQVILQFIILVLQPSNVLFALLSSTRFPAPNGRWTLLTSWRT